MSFDSKVGTASSSASTSVCADVFTPSSSCSISTVASFDSKVGSASASTSVGVDSFSLSSSWIESAVVSVDSIVG